MACPCGRMPTPGSASADFCFEGTLCSSKEKHIWEQGAWRANSPVPRAGGRTYVMSRTNSQYGVRRAAGRAPEPSLCPDPACPHQNTRPSPAHQSLVQTHLRLRAGVTFEKENDPERKAIHYEDLTLNSCRAFQRDRYLGADFIDDKRGEKA